MVKKHNVSHNRFKNNLLYTAGTLAGIGGKKILDYGINKATNWYNSKKSTKYTKPPGKPSGSTTSKYSRGKPRIISGVSRTDIGTGGELTLLKKNINIGSKRGLDRKLIRSNKNDTVYRFQGLSPYMNTTINTLYGTVTGGGAYPLLNAVNTRTAAGSFNKYVPLHLYDITCIPNIVNGGTAASPSPGYALRFDGTVGSGPRFPPTQVTFENLQGYQLDGVTTDTTLHIQKSTTASNSIRSIDSILQEYASINLLVYGATNMATEWSLKVFQLMDDSFAPFELNTTQPTSSIGYDQKDAAINFWESFVSKSMKHPLSKHNSDWKKHVKILKEMTFIQQPRLTNESDAVLGHAKQIKLFLPMYRHNNYRWLDTPKDTDLDNINTASVDCQSNSCHLKPKARIYFSIQATNVTETLIASTWGTTAYTPTYDIDILTKFTDIN